MKRIVTDDVLPQKGYYLYRGVSGYLPTLFIVFFFFLLAVHFPPVCCRDQLPKLPSIFNPFQSPRWFGAVFFVIA